MTAVDDYHEVTSSQKFDDMLAVSSVSMVLRDDFIRWICSTRGVAFQKQWLDGKSDELPLLVYLHSTCTNNGVDMTGCHSLCNQINATLDYDSKFFFFLKTFFYFFIF